MSETATTAPPRPRATKPLLEVDGVHKSFPGVHALRDMRLELRSGEVLALVGENGAGKSTLMKLLSGIETADAGRFRLNGEPFEAANPREALRLGISIIHQELNLVPHLTVAQNVFIGREPRRGRLLLDERRLNDATARLLETLRIPLDPRTVVGDLTVANQQMVEIAKALSHEPRVLILDEPTAALNETEVATLHELLRRFVRPGTGAIYISHRMEEINRVCDRVTVIRDGEYVDTVRTRTTSTSEIIARMVGRTIDADIGPVGVRDDRDVVLGVRGLSTKDLLTDVTFDLRRGEILGFAGLLGAGRTEVARALVGADPVSAGTITLHGRRVRIANPADAARLGIGYLSEDRKRFGLLLDHDVKANIALGSLSRTFSTAGFVHDRRARATARDYIGTLRIKTPSAEQITKYLSGGNQQKVVIAKWLATDCDILIIDEPTRGIDVGAKEEIYTLLNDLAGQGKSIIMISSELPEILRMSHRVAVMSEGRLTAVLPAAEANQENIMYYATLRPDRAAPTGATDTATGVRTGDDAEHGKEARQR